MKPNSYFIVMWSCLTNHICGYAENEEDSPRISEQDKAVIQLIVDPRFDIVFRLEKLEKHSSHKCNFDKLVNDLCRVGVLNIWDRYYSSGTYQDYRDSLDANIGNVTFYDKLSVLILQRIKEHFDSDQDNIQIILTNVDQNRPVIGIFSIGVDKAKKFIEKSELKLSLIDPDQWISEKFQQKLWNLMTQFYQTLFLDVGQRNDAIRKLRREITGE
jgi:hypothetical protein